ncbi:hypothetical protein BJ170DRAFT_610209 [Xylariales sp. AK1849]|nr:hypothetical protein BJ170DRAFT_610209 [Xylariales sp. AK1849]
MGRPAKAGIGREEQVNMNAEKRIQLLHELEMKHQYGAGQSDLLTKDEDVRRLKLRILMLRDENTTLRDQITQNNDTNGELVAKRDDLGAQLEAQMQIVRSQEKQLRKQEREFSSLKAELHSMNNLNQDSTNVLAEKLALSRELAVLKPELEHLRSQIAHQQATLAEKLALERQVNTLEVELANEKRATKRAMQKRESNDLVEDDLRKKLRETEKQLSAEKAQRERLEDQLAQEKRTHQLALQDQDSTRELESDLRRKLQDAHKQLRDSVEEKEKLEEQIQAEKRQAKKAQKNQENPSSVEEDELRSKLLAARKEVEKVRHEAQSAVDEAGRRSDAFEKKFEKLKIKFREAQGQLKQYQADLRKAQQSRPSVSEEVTEKMAGRQAFKKRKAQEIARDDITQITIATPSADDRPRRGIKKVFEPTLVGEKSMFSITPFLNRTKNVVEDTPKTEDDELADTSIIPQEMTEAVEVATIPIPIFTGADTATSSSEPTATVPLDTEKSNPPLKSRGRPKKVLGDAPSARKNAKPLPKAALKKTPKVVTTLENVVEESHENGPGAPEAVEKTQTVKFNFTLPQDTSTSSANTSKGEEPKKKKRKVLGSTKTLFDDEDAEPVPTRKPSKVAIGGVRVKGPLAGVRNAFAGASFSPLKRDRRGVGASFLA